MSTQEHGREPVDHSIVCYNKAADRAEVLSLGDIVIVTGGIVYPAEGGAQIKANWVIPIPNGAGR